MQDERAGNGAPEKHARPIVGTAEHATNAFSAFVRVRWLALGLLDRVVFPTNPSCGKLTTAGIGRASLFRAYRGAGAYRTAPNGRTNALMVYRLRALTPACMSRFNPCSMCPFYDRCWHAGPNICQISGRTGQIHALNDSG